MKREIREKEKENSESPRQARFKNRMEKLARMTMTVKHLNEETLKNRDK
jgi:hypothetical protein